MNEVKIKGEIKERSKISKNAHLGKKNGRIRLLY